MDCSHVSFSLLPHQPIQYLHRLLFIRITCLGAKLIQHPDIAPTAQLQQRFSINFIFCQITCPALPETVEHYKYSESML